MYGEFATGTSKEQRSLLSSRNFSLRPLSPAGRLDIWTVFTLTWQPVAIFFYALFVLTGTSLRFKFPALDFVIYVVGMVILLIVPVIALCVLVFGTIVTFFQTKIRSSAVVYWMWWPFWKVVLCVAFLCAGTCIGNYVYWNYLMPHESYSRMQGYQQIDPLSVSGLRLQDSSIVLFNESAGVDRARTGCLKNGVTYCVAPIMYANNTAATPGRNMAQLPFPQNEPPNNDIFNSDFTHRQQYDLFMVGTDCCSCPGEFRCGDWNRPGPLGAMRLLDENKRQFFRLASLEWATTYGKLVKHPIFYEWVADPMSVYQELPSRANRVIIASVLLAPTVAFLAVFVLNFILRLLHDSGLAAPVTTMVPSAGVGRDLSKRFLPQMYKHQMDEEAQQGNYLMPDPKYLTL